jgi:hypothetical protein
MPRRIDFRPALDPLLVEKRRTVLDTPRYSLI